MAQYRAARDYLRKANSEWGLPSRAACAALPCTATARLAGRALCTVPQLPALHSPLLCCGPGLGHRPIGGCACQAAYSHTSLAAHAVAPQPWRYSASHAQQSSTANHHLCCLHTSSASALLPAVVLAVAGSREKMRLLKEAITLYGTYIRCMAVHVFKVRAGSSPGGSCWPLGAVAGLAALQPRPPCHRPACSGTGQL